MKQSQKYVVLGLGLLSVVLTGLVVAQPQPGERGEEGRRGMRSPEERRERMTQRMKDYLEVKDEEQWKVLQPRLEKVMDLRQQTTGMAPGMMMFGRGPRPDGGPEGEMDRERNAVEKASDELQTLLVPDKAEPEKIKAALTALRQAREQAQQELVKAQAELKEGLTLQQEAKLVLAGYLN